MHNIAVCLPVKSFSQPYKRTETVGFRQVQGTQLLGVELEPILVLTLIGGRSG